MERYSLTFHSYLVCDSSEKSRMSGVMGELANIEVATVHGETVWLVL